MEERTKIFVGLDVYKESIAMAVADSARQAARLVGTLPHDLNKLLKRFQTLGEPSSVHVNNFGTDAQKQRFLRPILEGSQICCIGLTEPNAGSDAANIQTRAVMRDGQWVINGSKTVITNSGIAAGSPEFESGEPADEWQAIALNYTTGTTGNPKGVVYHHRGAYLAALSNMIDWEMPRHSVFLWTLPMFHCNGWCFAWTLAANAGTHVCLRRFEPRQTLAMIRELRVTHYCGAPVVHAMLAWAPAEWKTGILHRVHGLIGGAPPQVPVIAAMQRMGFEITQIYGLTEVFGPSVVWAEAPEWRALDVEALAAKKSWQGVRYTAQEGMAVLDPDTLARVPRDGRTVGEVMFRGNMTMKGYLKNPQAKAEAFDGGWFHSGDLAIVHPDGYVQIKNRAKDVIISGGEGINSVEVEEVLYRHPAVRAAAVVAKPHPKMGRDALRLRRTDAGRRGRRSRADRALPREPLRITRRRPGSWSANCRKPPPAKSRNSRCANARTGSTRPSGPSRWHALITEMKIEDPGTGKTRS